MTTPAEARARLDEAQSTYEQCVADLEKLTEMVPWLQEATARVHALFDYYREDGDKDTTAIYAADPEAVTPTVANEDAVWELMTGYDEAMMRLLRIVTAEITSSLDVPGCC